MPDLQVKQVENHISMIYTMNFTIIMIYFTSFDSFPAWTGWMVGSVYSFVGFSIAPYGTVWRERSMQPESATVGA